MVRCLNRIAPILAAALATYVALEILAALTTHTVATATAILVLAGALLLRATFSALHGDPR
jgi:hypothetical protein